jgi:hypothetical protein
MADLTIADYLKYADLQMAAEALYDFNAKLNASGLVPGQELKDKAISVEWLTTGNLHASKFTATDAKNFKDHWVLVDHISNTATGFSGTLFQNKDTGEMVMSIRSTEFLDDAARDNQATNVMEIKKFGFAFGQIADMENWYQSLKASGKLPADKHFSVTGYSLGGHLATAFNLMHNGDTFIDKVVTFNGAGVGQIKSAADNLGSVISAFDTLRKNADGQAFTFQNAALNILYANLRVTISEGTLPSTQDKAELEAIGAPEGASDAEIAQLENDKAKIREAMKRIEAIEEERRRLLGIKDGTDGAPAPIPASQIEQMNLDYQMAVLTVKDRTYAMNTPSGVWNAVTDKSYVDNRVFANQYDVVGTETTSSPWAAVANSQWHYGTDVKVFVEDQPFYRGSVLLDSLAQTWAYKDPKLLVNGYTQNDFADTHSLVLIVDSLRVQELFAKLDSTLTLADLSNLFTLASGLKKEATSGSQGKAEGDALENLLNALGEQLLGKGNFTRLKGDPNGNTWAKIKENGDTGGYSDREEVARLIARIAGVLGDNANQNALGDTTVKAASADLKDSARTDFASFLSLYTLSPFVLGGDYMAGLLQRTWRTVYDAWNADKNLSAEERAAGKATYSDQWLNDRAELMRNWLKAHAANTTQYEGDVATSYVGLNNAGNAEDGKLFGKVSRGGTPSNETQWRVAA